MTGTIVRTVVLALATAASTANMATAGSAFDGAWSVSAVTQHGGCDATYNFSVEIAGGVITLPELAGFSGHVSSGGTVAASVSTSGTRVTASGKLDGLNGRGQWDSRSNDDTCRGYWTAHRS
jgi:hypothetical protein